MAVSQETYIDISELEEVLLTRLEKFEKRIFSKALMTEIGNFAMTKIKVRTSEGKDVEGRYFKPYTAKYKMFRREKGLPTNVVDLFRTGSMLSSMTYDPYERYVKIFFLNTSDEFNVKNPKKAFFLNQKRRFFALSKDEVDKIVNMCIDYYNNLLDNM